MATKGVDVSYWQKEIDWNKVKASGIKFAIIRCGYGNGGVDSYFERNVKECERVGIPWGAYYFSYAESVEEAKRELDNCLKLLKGKKPSYPVYYDLEDEATTGSQSNSTILKMAKVFVNGIEKAGYWAGIYANTNWFNTRLTDSWYDRKAKWVAQYNDKNTYKKSYGIWQYTSSGKVNGISGNVDMNYCYVDYPTKIKGDATKPATPSKPSKPTTVKIEAPNLSEYLKEGDRNLAVYAYKQQLALLKKKGIIAQGVDNNEIFGAGTKTATKQVQLAAGITVDGLAGPQTIRACYVLASK